MTEQPIDPRDDYKGWELVLYDVAAASWRPVMRWKVRRDGVEVGPLATRAEAEAWIDSQEVT